MRSSGRRASSRRSRTSSPAGPSTRRSRPGRSRRRARTSATPGSSQSYSGSLALIDANTPIATFDDLDTTFWRRYDGSGSYNDVANWTPTASVGPGEDGTLAYGPAGVWLLYLTGTPGDQHLRRPASTPARASEAPCRSARPAGRYSPTSPRTPAAACMPSGSTGPATWSTGGPTTRRTTGRSRELAPTTFEIFHLEVAAGADGEGWVVWDGNSDRSTVQAAALEVPPERPTIGRTVTVDVVKGEVFVRLPAGSVGAGRARQGGGLRAADRGAIDPGPLDPRHAQGHGAAARGAQPRGQDPVGPVLGRRVPGAPVAQAEGEGPDRAAAEGIGRRLQELRRSNRSASAAQSRRAVRRLRAKAKGRYRTRGRTPRPPCAAPPGP